MARQRPHPAHARHALRSPCHLACTSGPDIGVVIASGVVGRAGAVPLRAADVSREHADVEAEGRRLRVTPAPGARPPLVRPRFGTWRRLGADGRLLRAGDRLRVGSDCFTVRDRPGRLAWARPRSAGRRAWLPFLSFAVMALLGGWRLAAVAPAGAVAAIALVLALVAVALAARACLRRAARVCDGARLALVLAALPGQSQPVRPAEAPLVWPGRPTHLGARIAVAGADAPPGKGPGARSLGFVGPGAHECALWCAGQIAAQTGGARVCTDQGTWTVGAPHAVIHITRSEACPHCAAPGAPGAQDAPVVHCGVGRAFEDLPPWCEQVFTARSAPVSPRWWWQVAASDDGAALPDMVEWEALGEAASGADGTDGDSRGDSDGLTDDGLAAPVGVGTDGEVVLDLVADGPHALVAGCTGSGKSEALLTWLLSMCSHHPPERVRLVLIDYKGGATFAPLSGLAHTECVLTDIDPGATARALRGIGALLADRERQLARIGVPDLRQWAQRHRADPARVAPPPARIVIAIDEFRVLVDSHPETMGVIMRLAAQGRSLGLHLVAATQRPAGAVSASMRANIDIRVALRCLTAADSMDVLGDDTAARIPRTPGRAVVTGRGPLQFARAGDARALVERINGRFRSCGRAPLWAPPIPASLTWEDVDARCPGGRALGLFDSVDSSGPAPVVWDGGPIEVQAPRSEARLAAAWVRSLAARAASLAGLPVHHCSQEPVAWAVSRVAPEDAAACARLLEGVCGHGPCVLAIDDLPAVLTSVSSAMGQLRCDEAWKGMLRGALAAGVVLVVASPGRFTLPSASMGVFSTRVLRAQSVDAALHAGIDSRSVVRLGAAEALVEAGGQEAALASVPLDAREPPGGGVRGGGWRVRTLAQGVEAAAGLSPAPAALVGGDYAPYRPSGPLPWVLVGGGECLEAARAIHAAAGWGEPVVADVVPEASWARLGRCPGARVLALDPNDNIVRALFQTARVRPASLLACGFTSTSGLLNDDGNLTNIQMIGGLPPFQRPHERLGENPHSALAESVPQNSCAVAPRTGN